MHVTKTQLSTSELQTFVKKDSSVITATVTKEAVTRFNDTLKAALLFNATNNIDSIESNGILVRGVWQPYGDSYKLHITAIAKPTNNITKEVASTTNIQQHNEGNTAEKKVEQVTKQKEIVRNKPPIVLIAFGILTTLLIYLYRKKIKTWLQLLRKIV